MHFFLIKLLMKGNQNSDLKYEIEDIRSARYINNSWEFFVKWKNYPETFNTWEPMKNFDSDDLIRMFWQKHDQKDFINPNNLFLPTNTLELTSLDGKDIFNNQFPFIKDSSDIKEIIRYQKRDDGLIYYYVDTEKYPTPIYIPSEWMKKHVPDKLIDFFELHVKC